MGKGYLTRTVWILSLVSLLADMASEMLYPVMPVYLRHIGFSMALIGVLEGLAGAIAGLSKGYFGQLSDLRSERLPFVRWGYFLSALSKPLMAVWTFLPWVFGARLLDRLGKGLRTGARDAMLSAESGPEHKAAVFGFHRSMDTLGAVVGPALALAFLHIHPGQYHALFYWAFLPGLASVLLLYLIRERGRTPMRRDRPSLRFLEFASYWRSADSRYRRLVAGLLAFALFNSSDAFLLLRMKSAGLGDTAVIGLYIGYNLIFALLAYPLGILADRIGMRRVLVSGIFVFALVYAGFSVADNLEAFAALFLLYGVYAAATEGVAKAWISSLSPRGETATAIGAYSAFESVAMLGASAMAGLLWQFFGEAAPFLVSSFAALIVGLYFLISAIRR